MDDQRFHTSFLCSTIICLICFFKFVMNNLSFLALCLTRGTMALFVRVIICHLIYHQRNIGLSLHTNFALSIFSSFLPLLYQYSYDLTHTHVSNCRSISTMDPIDNNPAIASYDFKNPITCLSRRAAHTKAHQVFSSSEYRVSQSVNFLLR